VIGRPLALSLSCQSILMHHTLPMVSRLKDLVNFWLEPLNIRVESRTAERVEYARLLGLEKNGQFSRPVFPVLSQFLNCDPSPVLDAVARFQETMKRFATPDGDGRYCYANDYFNSPDAEVAYALVRHIRPKFLIEVGSGNSTQLFRAAIEDGQLGTELISIDPAPRKAIEAVASRVIKQRLEQVPPSFICEALNHDDVLFIDSSHQICIGNDVINLLLNIVPALKKGVVIHLHDIFLPFEYPRQWIIDNRWPWNEQYLVQAMLQGCDGFEILWPGHFLQKTMPQFHSYFEAERMGTATSLWLRKVG
jgi:hypothetical protein